MSEVGLRERKKIETRRVIAEAALTLALERGPDQITVDDIARAADVSPRTVFNHFGTKDEAILGIDPERRSEILADIRHRPAAEAPLQAIVHVMVEVMTARGDAGRFWTARAQLIREHPHLHAAQLLAQRALEQDLAEVVAERTGLDAERDQYPLLLATLALAAIRLAMARAGSAGPRALRREMASAIEALSSGMQPPVR